MKNTFNSKTSQNIMLLFCLVIMLSGLCLTVINNAVISNGILGIGILLTGYNFMKLINQ